MGVEIWNPRLPYLYAIYNLIYGNLEKAIYLLDIQLKTKPNVFLIKDTLNYLLEIEKYLPGIQHIDICINFLGDFVNEKIPKMNIEEHNR